MKYVAIGASLLGLGACSSSGGGSDSADFSYAEAPQDLSATETPSTDYYSQDQAASETEAAPVLRKRTGGAAYRLSKFPEIAARPFQKGDFWMNGYLFVRGEQNWNQVSKLIYGRDDRAQLLAQWNGGRELSPGTVVYYNSPFRPEDGKTMKLFEGDFGLSLEGLTINEGDSLSLIAARVYGSPEAWRELASLNQDLLSSADAIEVGQTLRLSPSVRNTQPVLQAAIEKMRAEAEEALADNAAPVSDTPALQDEYQNEAAPQAPPVEVADAAPQNNVSDFEVTTNDPIAEESSSALLPMDDILFMLGALLCLAGIAVFVIRRRKATSKEANMVKFGKTGSED